MNKKEQQEYVSHMIVDAISRNKKHIIVHYAAVNMVINTLVQQGFDIEYMRDLKYVVISWK